MFNLQNYKFGVIYGMFCNTRVCIILLFFDVVGYKIKWDKINFFETLCYSNTSISDLNVRTPEAGACASAGASLTPIVTRRKGNCFKFSY